MNRPLIGVIVNPASGKDIRRLVAKASVFDNQEKLAIVRRAIAGAMATGVSEFRYLPDTHDIAAVAFQELKGELLARAIASPLTGTALDTRLGAAELRTEGCNVVISLGGDGTNRAVVSGWRNVPLVPVSTGTNNAFPVMVEATVAGAAAGLVAAGWVNLRDVADQAKVITVQIDGEEDDLALVDAVVTTDRFIGARALLDSDRLMLALLTRANPAAVGVASIGGLLELVDPGDDHGLLVEFTRDSEGSQRRINAPIAPGLYQEMGIAEVRKTHLQESVEISGPCVLALDGERERVLKAGQAGRMKVQRDGPWVIDVDRSLRAGAQLGAFDINDGETHAH